MLLRLAAIVALSAAVATLPAALESRHEAAARESGATSGTAGTLRLYRLAGGAVELVEDGGAAAPGDRVQLAYDAGAHEHGVIFSVDGSGRVTLHFPRHEQAPTLLEGARGVLPFSFVLDDAPGSERFYFVASERPLDVRAALRCQAKPLVSLRKQPGAPRAPGVR